MLDLNDPNLFYIVLAILLGFAAGWLIWRSSRRPRVQEERRDHLAEHQVPTQGTFARVHQGPIAAAHQPPAPEQDAVVAPRHDPVPAKGATRVDVSEAEEPPADPVAKIVPGQDGPEPNDILTEAAAATADVVGEFLGVDTHGTLTGREDDLQTMKGVGPKLAAILRAEGLLRFEQIAALTPDQVSALDAKLGAFKGRLARDRVVEQAGYLARADREGYERAFGKL